MKKLGPLSTDEKITAGALGLTVGLWIFGGNLGINAVAAALLGLAILLITNVVTWKECLSDNQAWDTLTWFAALIGMASYLNKFGFIKWFSDEVRSTSVLWGLGLGEVGWRGDESLGAPIGMALYLNEFGFIKLLFGDVRSTPGSLGLRGRVGGRLGFLAALLSLAFHLK